MTQQIFASPPQPPSKPQWANTRYRFSQWLLCNSLLLLCWHGLLRLIPELETQANNHSTRQIAEVRTEKFLEDQVTQTINSSSDVAYRPILTSTISQPQKQLTGNER